jgi:beta-1,4-mannosyl-glycoprotein beta-1,4-N-acetylglucosaminyltransferase
MIVDCFTFYNELHILKKRLKYLYPVVDKFVLVESTVTHRGEPKELFYEKHKQDFAEWSDKIIHVIVRDNPMDTNPWVRENFQRNCISRGLVDVNDDDIIMISDVDEIPDRDIVKNHLDAPICSFHMLAFQYNFEYLQVNEPWFGTVMTKTQTLKVYTPQKLREMRWSIPYYKNAGWHLSSFGDEEFVANKIYNFAHCHDESSQNKTKDTYKMFIERGVHTDGKMKLAHTPEELLNNVPKDLKEL